MNKRLAESSGSVISVVINGQQREIAANCTIEQLLQQLDMSVVGIAVEINSQIQPGSEFRSITINESDRIEIVSLVGGG